MAAAIGIKLANGEFYPIMEENKEVKKRLVLTTVHDNQKSVQIDLYKSRTNSMADSMYIGSLVVEDIDAAAKGEAAIELVVSSTEDGIVNAETNDLGKTAGPSGEKQQLSLHLKSFEEDPGDYSDFDVDGSGVAVAEQTASSGPEQPRKFPWIIIIGLGILLVLLCLGLWFFLLKNGARKNGQNPSVGANAPVEKPLPEPGPPSAPEPAAEFVPAETPPEKPVIIDTPPRALSPAPDRRQRLAAPVHSFKVPQTIPPEGISYTIRWGDTLWDISEAFYRNSWLYSRIVRHNNIRNPNLIVSGTEIIILPGGSR